MDEHPDRVLAKRLIAMLDLKHDGELGGPENLDALLQQVKTAAGPVACVFVAPDNVGPCAAALYRTRTLVGASFNVEGGDIAGISDDISAAVADGAGEIAITLRPHAQTSVDSGYASLFKEAKMLVERRKLTIALDEIASTSPAAMVDIARMAIAAGADFIKVPVANGTTPDAVGTRQVLGVILQSGGRCGVKFSGNIDELSQGRTCYELVSGIMGEGWIWPGSFRIQSARLLPSLLLALGNTKTVRPVGCGVNETR